MALTGAMSAGISGLKAHMDALTTVGNNVANVNTYGYKPGRVIFKESIYSTQAAGTDGTELIGGTNPRQTGYGCSVGTIDLDMSTMNVESTGMPSDVAIQGDGFFLLGDKNGVAIDDIDSLMLSRVGDFDIDPNGYLTDGYGNIVYGFASCNVVDPEADPLVKSGTAGPNGDEISTQLVPLRLPIAATVADDTNGIEIGDAIYPGVVNGENTLDAYAGGECISYNSLSIDPSGLVTCVNDKTNEPVVIGYVALGTVQNPGGLTHTEGPYYQAREGCGKMSVCAPNGALAGEYLNNAQANEPGATLDNMLGEGGASLLPNFLEASGTDLAAEFANMIIYQRGYQANTRIVTVTDSMLEELVNMKR